jgi:hypothetical protein
MLHKLCFITLVAAAVTLAPAAFAAKGKGHGHYHHGHNHHRVAKHYKYARTVGTATNTARSVGTHAVASWLDPFGTVRKLTSM